MSTKDIIIGAIDYGSFRFPIQFIAFGGTQIITDAVFDTGCSHSLISINSLNGYGKPIEEIKYNILYDKYSKLNVSFGVESKGRDLTQIKHLVNKINQYKEDCKDEIDLINMIDNNITKDEIKLILDSNNIRFDYPIEGLYIDGVYIGDFNVKISYRTNGINLIGMHIIKELYTKIYCKDKKTYLLAMKNSNNIDEMDHTMREVEENIDLYSDE